MQEIKRILPFLLNRLDEGRLAFFIGAGIPSTEAGLPSGKQLKQLLLGEMRERNSNQGLPEVAERFEETTDRIQLFEFLKGKLRFGGNLDDDSVCCTYKMSLELPVKTILTTNFDCLIEQCALKKAIELNVYELDKKLANFKPAGTNLLKVHGDLNVPPDKLVVTTSDYGSYTHNYPHFCHYIKTVFLQNTVVFLGYRLEDSNLLSIYESVLSETGVLKKKSYAALLSDPGVEIRERWMKQKVQIVVSPAQNFVSQLLGEYKRKSVKFPPPDRSVKVISEGHVPRPSFRNKDSSYKVRKAFAYFIARQKRLLKQEVYAFCTIDTLQTTVESLDPSRKVGRKIQAKAYEIADALRFKGHFPEILPPTDEVPEARRRHRIDQADFCIIFIASSTYEKSLNSFYGPVAYKKPILAFIHNKFRGKVKEDLLLAGLRGSGAHIGLFKTRDIGSCNLRRSVEDVLGSKMDEWLAASIGI